MDLFLQLLIVGLSNGAIYALIALGYTMVYGIIELINFAHGDIFMVGTFVVLTVLNLFGVTIAHPPKAMSWSLVGELGVACVAAVVVCAILGVVIERVAYRPLRNAPRLAPLISAIGVSLVLEDAAKLWKGNADVSFIPVPLGSFTVGGVEIKFVNLLVIGVALVLMLALYLLIQRTRMGRAMRAVAQDREAAALMGVNVDRIIMVTFFIGAGLAGAASFIYALKFTGTKFTVGYELGLIAFTCAVLGGIGSITGAMLGGLVIGIVGALVSYIKPSVLPHGGDAWANAIIFTILILILVFRPTGLLGQQTPEKV